MAEAQAGGIRQVAAAISSEGGLASVNTQLAQPCLTEFGKLAKTNNTMIVPADLANVAGVLKAATTIVKDVGMSVIRRGRSTPIKHRSWERLHRAAPFSFTSSRRTGAAPAEPPRRLRAYRALSAAAGPWHRRPRDRRLEARRRRSPGRCLIIMLLVLASLPKTP